MDIHISEEYVIRRRREKSIRLSDAGNFPGGGGLGQGNEERRARELWKTMMKGFMERKGEISSGAGDKGSHDLLFGCFSA